MDKGKTKLYTVKVEDTEEDDCSNVRGTILIEGVIMDVLFDSVCTQSFISSQLVKRL